MGYWNYMPRSHLYAFLLRRYPVIPRLLNAFLSYTRPRPVHITPSISHTSSRETLLLPLSPLSTCAMSSKTLHTFNWCDSGAESITPVSSLGDVDSSRPSSGFNDPTPPDENATPDLRESPEWNCNEDADLRDCIAHQDTMPGDSEESAEAIWTWPACRQSAALAQKDHQPLPRMPIFSAQPISSSSANARVSESYNISSDLDIMVTDLDSSGGRHQDNNHSLREALESWAALDISGVHEAVSHAEERTQQSISELRDHAKSVLMATEIEERLLRTRLEALKSTLLQSTSTIWEDARYSQLARENGNRLNGNMNQEQDDEVTTTVDFNSSAAAQQPYLVPIKTICPEKPNRAKQHVTKTTADDPVRRTPDTCTSGLIHISVDTKEPIDAFAPTSTSTPLLMPTGRQQHDSPLLRFHSEPRNEEESDMNTTLDTINTHKTRCQLETKSAALNENASIEMIAEVSPRSSGSLSPSTWYNGEHVGRFPISISRKQLGRPDRGGQSTPISCSSGLNDSLRQLKESFDRIFPSITPVAGPRNSGVVNVKTVDRVNTGTHTEPTLLADGEQSPADWRLQQKDESANMMRQRAVALQTTSEKAHQHPHTASSNVHTSYRTLNCINLEERYNEYMAQLQSSTSIQNSQHRASAESSLTDVSLPPPSTSGDAIADPLKRKLLHLVNTESGQLKAAKEAYQSKKQVLKELRTLLSNAGYQSNWSEIESLTRTSRTPMGTKSAQRHGYGYPAPPQFERPSAPTATPHKGQTASCSSPTALREPRRESPSCCVTPPPRQLSPQGQGCRPSSPCRVSSPRLLCNGRPIDNHQQHTGKSSSGRKPSALDIGRMYSEFIGSFEQSRGAGSGCITNSDSRQIPPPPDYEPFRRAFDKRELSRDVEADSRYGVGPDNLSSPGGPSKESYMGAFGPPTGPDIGNRFNSSAAIGPGGGMGCSPVYGGFSGAPCGFPQFGFQMPYTGGFSGFGGCNPAAAAGAMMPPPSCGFTAQQPPMGVFGFPPATGMPYGCFNPQYNNSYTGREGGFTFNNAGNNRQPQGSGFNPMPNMNVSAPPMHEPPPSRPAPAPAALWPNQFPHPNQTRNKESQRLLAENQLNDTVPNHTIRSTMSSAWDPPVTSAAVSVNANSAAPSGTNTSVLEAAKAAKGGCSWFEPLPAKQRGALLSQRPSFETPQRSLEMWRPAFSEFGRETRVKNNVSHTNPPYGCDRADDTNQFNSSNQHRCPRSLSLQEAFSSRMHGFIIRSQARQRCIHLNFQERRLKSELDKLAVPTASASNNYGRKTRKGKKAGQQRRAIDPHEAHLLAQAQRISHLITNRHRMKNYSEEVRRRLLTTDY